MRDRVLDEHMEMLDRGLTIAGPGEREKFKEYFEDSDDSNRFGLLTLVTPDIPFSIILKRIWLKIRGKKVTMVSYDPPYIEHAD